MFFFVFYFLFFVSILIACALFFFSTFVVSISIIIIISLSLICLKSFFHPNKQRTSELFLLFKVGAFRIQKSKRKFKKQADNFAASVWHRHSVRVLREMKSSLSKLRRFALHKSDTKDKIDFLPSSSQVDDLDQAAQV